MKNILTGIFAVALLASVFAFSSSAHAIDESCTENSSKTDESLLKCYQADFENRFKSNEQTHRRLIEITRSKFTEASNADRSDAVAKYMKMASEINRTVINTRVKAAKECAILSGKFGETPISDVATLNCRAGFEVSLTKELTRLESKLNRINGIRVANSSLVSARN